MADAYSATFTPQLGHHLGLRVRRSSSLRPPRSAPAPAPASVRFTARVPPAVSYTWQVWTNLPAVSASLQLLSADEWNAIAFPDPAGDVDTHGDGSATSPANAQPGHPPADERTELTLDVLVDFAQAAKTEFAYTYRCVTEAGVLWLGTPDSNGRITFEVDEAEEAEAEIGAEAGASIGQAEGAGKHAANGHSEEQANGHEKASGLASELRDGDVLGANAHAPEVDGLADVADTDAVAEPTSEASTSKSSAPESIQPVAPHIDAAPEPADSLDPTPDLVGSSSGSSVGSLDDTPARSHTGAATGTEADADVGGPVSFLWHMLRCVLDLLFGWVRTRDGGPGPEAGRTAPDANADERTPLLRTRSRASDATDVLLTPDVSVVPPTLAAPAKVPADD
ncbi:hypothetical protein Q5752_004089 [Cryptotrichosporon argae]